VEVKRENTSFNFFSITLSMYSLSSWFNYSFTQSLKGTVRRKIKTVFFSSYLCFLFVLGVSASSLATIFIRSSLRPSSWSFVGCGPLNGAQGPRGDQMPASCSSSSCLGHSGTRWPLTSGLRRSSITPSVWQGNTSPSVQDSPSLPQAFCFESILSIKDSSKWCLCIYLFRFIYVFIY